jgi:hypothetical protein
VRGGRGRRGCVHLWGTSGRGCAAQAASGTCRGGRGWRGAGDAEESGCGAAGGFAAAPFGDGAQGRFAVDFVGFFVGEGFEDGGEGVDGAAAGEGGEGGVALGGGFAEGLKARAGGGELGPGDEFLEGEVVGAGQVDEGEVAAEVVEEEVFGGE